MLLIIYLMLLLSFIRIRLSPVISAPLAKGEAFCGKRQALPVFPLFYHADPSVPRRYCDRFRAIDQAFAAGAGLALIGKRRFRGDSGAPD
jgi:hypothetical protein